MIYLDMNMGSLLLGFTSHLKCMHCDKITNFQIREEYNKTSIMSIIPTGTDWGRTLKICPICNDKEVVTSTPLFTSSAKRIALVQMLDGGKEVMKETMKKINFEDREKILERLTKKQAFYLVDYLRTD
jgi:hypothetical protein